MPLEPCSHMSPPDYKTTLSRCSKASFTQSSVVKGTRTMLSATLFGRKKKEKQKILGLTLPRTATNRNPPGKCSDTLTRKESHVNKNGWNRIKMPEQRKTVALLPQSKSAQSTEEHQIKENTTK